jgi:hypothetical protein
MHDYFGVSRTMPLRLAQCLTVLLLAVALLVALPLARPFNTPTIDGNIRVDAADWDGDDLAVDDPLLDTAWGPNDIDDLWMTYDADNLYIGVRYQVSNNAMLVLIDAGTGVGAQNINGLDWYPRNFNFPDSSLGEFIIANWNGGALGVRRITGPATTEDVTAQCFNSNGPQGNSFYEAEVQIPWEVVYQSDPGKVVPNARVKAVALIAGGDNWNGPDSAPDNPGMTGDGSLTTLFNMAYRMVDSDGDGVPDGFTGAISGEVTYEDALDVTTVATVRALDASSGAPVAETLTAPGGGAYILDRLADGDYDVEVSARGYGTVKIPATVTGQATTTGVDAFLEKAGKITGTVGFADGPGAAVTVTATDAAGDVSGGGPVDLPAGGDYEFLVPSGAYTITAEAPGYVPGSVTATVSGSDSVGADPIDLSAVRATRLVLIDPDTGEEIPSLSTTVSFPDSGIFFLVEATIEARDDMGRRDLYDVEGHGAQVDLTAYKLNNTTPPRGNVIFYDFLTPITSVALDQGRATFRMTDDEIEVLRIFTTTATGNISGRFKLGVRSTEPEYIELRALESSIVADGVDEVAIEGRLLDVSRNPVTVADVPVSFSLTAESTGRGSFTVPSTVTSPTGEVSTSLLATGTGTLQVTCSATYLNKDLIVVTDAGYGHVEITATPGAPAGIVLSTTSEVVGLNQSIPVYAQLVDGNGNPVPQSGYAVDFTTSPAAVGNINPASVALDATGRAATSFTAGTNRSVVAINATSSPALPVTGTSLLIDKILLFSDPVAPEPDPGPNSFSAMDLTTVSVGNDPDAMTVNVHFATSWAGAHLGLLIEAGNDPAGGVSDPFGFPISYGHANKPEFALTYKYSTDDYADLRKWDGTQWLWWDDEGKEYRSEAQGWVEGVNIRPTWVVKDTASVSYRIPLDIFEGNVPPTLRFQVYLMQEEEQKRSAFDSAPSDATLDLDFDPDDPNADWSVTLTPVVLTQYSPDYEVNRVFPTAPTLDSPLVTPDPAVPGQMVTLSVAVADAGDGIGNVLADLTSLGGPRFQLMSDDGTGSDATAGDGVYTTAYMLGAGVSGGIYGVTFTAKDAGNVSSTEASTTFSVQGATSALRTIVDDVDDDHGPNQFGKDGLYYLYPTNSVFVQGAFDLEQVTLFETSKIVAGEIIPSIGFEVKVRNHPDPAEEGTADWNPTFADINIQKVDIYIDAFKGGATEGLPNRQNDFSRWDAWDYAIVMEGWYKGVIPSNSQNTPQAWVPGARKTDRDIVLLSDFVNNTITAIVSREALGNPSAEEIQKWDIVVVMTSHDGNSDDNNFGDTRWVNAGVSEWQPGGGSDNDRDANILDLVTSPGQGKKAGRTQSEMLDYKSPDAVARSENGETAVVLEASAFEDQGPPVIDIGAVQDETVPFTALVNAPLYLTAVITDDDQVASATLRWRPDSTSSADEWTGVLRMGFAGNDVWSVDLPIDEITDKVPVAPLDGTRNIEFMIEARDQSGNTATSPLYTMEIPQPQDSYQVTGLELGNGLEIRAPEGTVIRVPVSAIPAELRDQPLDFTLRTHRLSEFSLPPRPATDINVLRSIEVSAGGARIDEFEDWVEILLHYPQYSVESIDEQRIGVFKYNDDTRTWLYRGGTVNPYGNLVAVQVMRSGILGLFYDPSHGYNADAVLSGVEFSPNPFSPNGDGLYDETTISFYLSQDATLTIDIFDIEGNAVRTLRRFFSITSGDNPDSRPGRITGLSWDGRDNSGELVPYGVFIVRFSVTFSQAAGQRTVRFNKAVAVIR